MASLSDKLLTTHEISRLLQVDPTTVTKWIDRGLLTAYRTPGGHRRVRPSDLRSFLIAHQMPLPHLLGTDRVTIVVVDDDEKALAAIRRSFRPYDRQVDLLMTTSGVEALLLVTERQPHGMLVDLNMPDLDGYEVCRRILERKQFAGIKLITMTSRVSNAVAESSRQAGALMCLEKPVNAAQVVEYFRLPMALASPRATPSPAPAVRRKHKRSGKHPAIP